MDKVKTKKNGRTDLSQFQNAWFNPGASYFKRACWFVVNALIFINPLNPFFKLKIVLLRWFGAEIGKQVVIKQGVNIKYPWNLKVGDYSWIGERVWIDNLVSVTIGDHVCISQGTYLLTGNHNFTKPSFDLLVEPITIEDGVWLGAKSIVAPGVTCHSHSMLSLGSVATNDLEEYTIYQGVPAKPMKERVIQ